MSAALIGVSFTRNNMVTVDHDTLTAAVAAVPDSVLENEKFLQHLGDWVSDNYDNPEDIRDLILAGAAEYVHATSGSSNLTFWTPVPRTTLEFIFMGGVTWGDDPFEGFTELVLFIEALPHLGIPESVTGFVCGGLPLVTQIEAHRVLPD